MSVMGWAGPDERKCSDGRVAEEMALKSCSVVQNKGGLLTKHSNKHINEIGAFKQNMQIKKNQMIGNLMTIIFLISMFSALDVGFSM